MVVYKGRTLINSTQPTSMKNLSFVVVSVFVAILSTSCVVPVQRAGGAGYYQQHNGQQRQVAQKRQLRSVTVNQTRTGHCEARIINGPDNTQTNIDMVADYAASVHNKTGRVPSEQCLSQKFGFGCQARWVDDPDKVVKSITVRPGDVPDNIRRRFE